MGIRNTNYGAGPIVKVFLNPSALTLGKRKSFRRWPQKLHLRPLKSPKYKCLARVPAPQHCWELVYDTRLSTWIQ